MNVHHTDRSRAATRLHARVVGDAMKVLVFGGTRGVGRFFVKAAHDAGHQVTVFARDPQAVAAWSPPGVRVVKGDAKDRETVVSAVPGHDAIIISLGPTGKERLQHFVGRATAWIVEAMQAANVRRVILMSGLGVGESRKDAPRIMRWVAIPTLLGPTFRDRGKAEAVVRQSALDWTIVRPLYLTDDAPTGRWRATMDGRTVRGGIPRADVAGFLLGELTDREHVGKAVALDGL